MAVGRRSFMALLGLGGAAAPVALPAFGKAIAQKQMMRNGLGAIGGAVGREYYGSDAPDVLSSGRSLRDTVVKEFLGKLIHDQQEAEERRQRFHDVAIDNYQLPSWSPSFKQMMIRHEYDRRNQAARSVSEQIQEKMKSFVGFGDKETDVAESRYL
jgi:hypothetical protein